MKCLFIISICLMVLINSINTLSLKSRDECICKVNGNEIAPIIPCLKEPTSTTISGCVSDAKIISEMNNQTCLAYQPWSPIQEFMSKCTEVKSQKSYAKWVVNTLCPKLNKDQIDICNNIIDTCIDFEDTQCLCKMNLYKHKELYSCFHQNDTTSSYNYCKDNGWVIESSAIYNINYKILPIGILALFATFFF
ncbi:hypothetical protein BCR32DRAFT_293040 [Anaeromyces robustus]|uniref:Extracellular membrane protein CFEM domain-containing protein n=1 Tax=Anaeromyces robustus TaxID=1754192 RepID=A0A1Y1X7W8_9FUNG|nr:hypothetical protein BCR32DRAFT_293040 [Anaeromyces robustus]|eukprot:ORX81818.1 hypothetical protein BCR32DRAFT_293040 [Anaeromyces robustus]